MISQPDVTFGSLSRSWPVPFSCFKWTAQNICTGDECATVSYLRYRNIQMYNKYTKGKSLKKKEKLDDNEMDEWSLSVNTTSDHFYFSCTNKRQVPISTAVAMSRQDLYHWTSCERLEHKQLYHSTTQKGKLVKKTQYCKQNWRWWKRNTLKLRKERS